MGGGYGLIGDIIGIAGAFVGGWLFSTLGVHSPWGGPAGTIFTAFIGAVVLLFVLRLLRRGTRAISTSFVTPERQFRAYRLAGSAAQLLNVHSLDRGESGEPAVGIRQRRERQRGSRFVEGGSQFGDVNGFDRHGRVERRVGE